MRETIRKMAGPICLIIMIIEIVCGIMDSSMQAFIVAFLAGLMGVLYITDTKKEKSFCNFKAYGEYGCGRRFEFSVTCEREEMALN